MVDAMEAVSIIIPCYNHGEFLFEALEPLKSLLTENIAEVIIVNDGSTEERTRQVLLNLEQKGWRVINQTNKGLAKARNVGIEQAKCRYILPLDSDNVIAADFVKKAIKILDTNPATDIVYSDHIRFGETAESYSKVGAFNACRLITNNYIDACAVYRKEVWAALGGYDEKMPAMGHEDWDFWIGAFMRGKIFFYTSDVGFKYRVREGSMLQVVTKHKTEDNRRYIYAKYNTPLFESIRQNYEGRYTSKYLDLIRDLNNNRLRHLIKILIGKKYVDY